MAAERRPLPRISVVMPSYNQGRFLGDALESIFRQQYPDLEVIVMDGGSTDDSVAIIRAYAARLKHWQSAKDGGQSAAINAGMRHATGEIVAWLNSDDLYWGDALWQIANAYLEHPGHGLYLGNGLRYDQNTGVYTPFCDRHMAFNRDALIHGTDYLLQPSTFFLREAWETVGGLDPTLSYCMDWDLFIRIAKLYPAVVLHEFLSVSREYDDTKTRSGKMKRAAEIVRMVQAHTHSEITPGSLLFLCETLLDVTKEGMPRELDVHVRAMQDVLARHLSARYGGGHGFPEQSDPQDQTYLPFATESHARPLPTTAAQTLPAISIVVPVALQDESFQRTIASIQHQHYANVETVVAPEHAQGPAGAVRAGLDQANADILAWLHPGQLLAAGALHEVARAFSEDPQLDLIYGNAVHLDRQHRLRLADDGGLRTGMWLGKSKTKGCFGAPFPQPTVFFRRRLLERCGPWDESLRFVFDVAVLTRFAEEARIKKLERIQAFLVPDAEVFSRSRCNARLVELYRLQRAGWPSVFSPRFPAALRDFLRGYMRRKFSGRPSRLVYWGAAALAALAATTRLGNPERWWQNRLHVPAEPALFDRERIPGRCHSLFCAPRLPRADTGSADEIRDLHLLRRLRAFSTIEFFSLDPEATDSVFSPGADPVNAVHTVRSIAALRADLVHPAAARPALRSRLVNLLRRLRLPVTGPRYPLHIGEQMASLQANCRNAVQETLQTNRPEFLFLSPQSNPLALLLATESIDTRVILVAREVEAERMQTVADSLRGIARIAQNAEARRTRAFEADNLACCDGIIVACEADKRRFSDDYGFPAARIHVEDAHDEHGLQAWLLHLKNLPRRRDAESCPSPRANTVAA